VHRQLRVRPHDTEGRATAERLAGRRAVRATGRGEETTNPGEIVYRDDHRIDTRRWNYRDCDVTQITDGTKHFVLMIEAPSKEITEEAVEFTAIDLVNRSIRCYQGTFLVSKVKPTKDQQTFEF
jgi:DNA/RNA-binding domain of Phe-tRNA-synthetase-like protein